MKSKKWLLIIVSIVFFLNISFYGIIHLGKIDRIVKDRVTAFLSESMDAEVSIGDFTFNDRNIKVTNFHLKKKDELTLSIDQLYIEYNLLKLLFSKFNNLEAIKHIKIHQPKVVMNIVSKPKEDEKKIEFEIPDIAQFFKLLHIYNGYFSVAFQNEKIKLSSELNNIELEVKNEKKSEILFSCISDNDSKLSAKAILNKGEIDLAEFNLFNYFPQELQLAFVDSLKSSIDFSVIYRAENLQYSGKFNSTFVESSGKKAIADTIIFGGNELFTAINFKNFKIDNEPISLNAKISKPFSKERTITGFSRVNELSISKYIPTVEGWVTIDAEFSGDLLNPIVEVKAVSNQIITANQVIDDVEIQIDYYDKAALIGLVHCFWEENEITGTGTYNLNDGFNFDAIADEIVWNKNKNKISGKLKSNIKYVDDIIANLNLTNLKIELNDVVMDNFEFSGMFTDQEFQFFLNRPQQDFEIFGEGSLNDFLANVKLRRFDLSNFDSSGKQLPTLTGNIELKLQQEKITVDSRIRAYGKNFGELDGLFNTKIIADKKTDSTFFCLKSSDAKFNYEPIKIELEAKGSMDSIATTRFVINDNIKIDNWIKLKPELNYAAHITGNGIKIKEIFRYFTNYYTKENMNGLVDIDIYYDNLGSGKADGLIIIDDFRFGEFPSLDTEIKIAGNNKQIDIKNVKIVSDNVNVLSLNSSITLQPDFEMQVSGKAESLDLESLFVNDEISGLIQSNFEFVKGISQSFSLNVTAKELFVNKLEIDDVNIAITQFDELLQIDAFNLRTEGNFDFKSEGSIGYNFLNKTSYPDSNSLTLSLSGDPLKILSKLNKTLSNGSSKCEATLKLGIEEGGLSFKNGYFIMENGKISIKDQPKKIDDLDINLHMIDNVLSLEKFRLTMGDGKFYIQNSITNSEKDFQFGLLNIGKFQIRTNKSGMLFSIPQFIPENSYIQVVVSGRDDKFLTINGPFEDVEIVGDVELSNGNVIFPPNTENLLKLFNVVREKKENAEPIDLPLSFDIMLNFGENMRYVTYPADIELNSNCYINLIYRNDTFIIPTAFFSAEQGSVDMFGTKLSLDNMLIQMNQFEKGAKINGTFFKRAADGTIITLRVYNDIDGKLKFDFLSDNPNDKITDILSKLRYNRSMDEISQGQKKTLMQDEFIQIAGIGLESAVLAPLISPVENWIRKMFRLDYFHLNTDLVQNIFSNYSSQTESFIDEDKSGINQFTADILLNNLSINMGKYISNQVFVDYKTRFEKPVDVSFEASLGIFHEFALRYDLPYRFNVSYRFNIMPFDKEDSHEVRLEKSIQFGNFITLFEPSKQVINH